MDLLSQLEHIENKLRAMQEDHRVLTADNEKLRTTIRNLTAQISLKDEEINNVKEQNKITKLASGLQSQEDPQELRTQLDELIAEVDQCIKLIKR